MCSLNRFQPVPGNPARIRGFCPRPSRPLQTSEDSRAGCAGWQLSTCCLFLAVSELPRRPNISSIVSHGLTLLLGKTVSKRLSTGTAAMFMRTVHAKDLLNASDPQGLWQLYLLHLPVVFHSSFAWNAAPCAVAVWLTCLQCYELLVSIPLQTVKERLSRRMHAQHLAIAWQMRHQLVTTGSEFRVMKLSPCSVVLWRICSAFESVSMQKAGIHSCRPSRSLTIKLVTLSGDRNNAAVQEREHQSGNHSSIRDLYSLQQRDSQSLCMHVIYCTLTPMQHAR